MNMMKDGTEREVKKIKEISKGSIKDMSYKLY